MGSMPRVSRCCTAVFVCQVAYCENNVECRRAQTLSHFDEDFDCMQCKGGCDNCSSKVISTTRDVTVEAQGIVRIVEHMMASQSQPRINIVADIFREAKTKGVEKYRESEALNQQQLLRAHVLL